jgi:ABC-type dipeptide/oligopeptide/nickel transport system permease subunit
LMASTRISLDKTSLIMIFTLIIASLESIMITILYSLIYRVTPSVSMLKLYIPQILLLVLISPVFFRIFNQIVTLSYGEYAKQLKRT